MSLLGVLLQLDVYPQRLNLCVYNEGAFSRRTKSMFACNVMHNNLSTDLLYMCVCIFIFVPLMTFAAGRMRTAISQSVVMKCHRAARIVKSD